MDWRDIDVITINYRFTLPKMDNIMDCLSEACYFFKIVFISRYHHLLIREGNEWKIIFKKNKDCTNHWWYHLS